MFGWGGGGPWEAAGIRVPSWVGFEAGQVES